MSNATSKLCFARRHMPAQMESFHRYALATSHKSGIFYSDVRRDAVDYGINKDTIATWTKWLEKGGWFERLDKRLKRNPITGMYTSIRYRVLSHDEWVAKHPGNCRYIKGRSEEPGQDAPVRNTRTGHQSEKAGTTCPKNPEPPVRKTRTKTVKIDCKERESGETGKPPLAFSFDGREKLTDLVVKTAVQVNGAALFSGKARTELDRIIRELSPPEDDLIFLVRQIVGTMDAFQLKNAGAQIAATLAGHLAARSEAVAAATAKREATHAANLRKIAESESAHADWKKRFEEMIDRPSIEDGGGSIWERGSEGWCEEVQQWLRSNRQPTRFTVSNGELRPILDNTVIDSSIAQAVHHYTQQFEVESGQENFDCQPPTS
jgi:hypothetical protein